MKKVWQLILSILLVFMVFGCGGGDESSDDPNGKTINDISEKYSVSKNRNVALLGALKDANVTAYKFYSPDTIIEETQTNRVGEFSLKLDGVESEELIILRVKGGYDIDANNNGYIDKNPTKNNGTIALVTQANDIRNQKIKVSLLSDIVYRFTKHMIGKIDQDDFLKIMSYVASKLIKHQKYSSENELLDVVTRFNPIDNISKNKLSFNYNDILDKDKTKLIEYYHEGNDEAINNELERIFNVLSMNDGRYFEMRKKVKVELSTPIDTDINSSNSTIYYDFDKKDKNLIAFLDKNTSFSLKANVKSDNKIIGWRGCSDVSADNKTCFLNNIQEDKFIVAVTVPDKIEMNPNITFRDLTGSIIHVANDKYSVESADASMQNTLNSVNVGDVILNRNKPAFFKEVVSVQKISDSKYTYDTKFIPLEEVVRRGYVLSSTKNSNLPNQSKVAQRSVTFDSIDGNRYNLKPDKDGFYHINFSNTKSLERAIECNGLDCKGKTDFYKGKFYDGNVEVAGSLSFKPIFDFNMGWSWGTLKSLSLETGVNVKPQIDLKIKLYGKKFNPEKNQLGSISITQVLVIGIIPVTFTEGVDFYMGVEGEIEAYYSTNASLNADLSIITSWVKDEGVSIDRKFKFGGFSVKPFEYGVKGSVMGFVEVSPFLSVYVFGVAFSNKIGLYGEAKALVKVESIYDHQDNAVQGKFTEAGFEAGAQWKLALEPRFPYLVSEMPFVKELKEKMGSYEFVNIKYPLYKKLKSANAGYDKVDIKGDDLYLTKYSDDNVRGTKEYELKNTGHEKMYYSARIVSENLKDIVTFDNGLGLISGEIGEQETKQIKVNVVSNDLSKFSGDNTAKVAFYLSRQPLNSILFSMDNIIPKKSFTVGLRVFKSAEKITNFLAQISSDMIGDKLSISFDRIDSENVDGYIIYKALANENGICSKNYNIFHIINNADISSYKIYIKVLNALTGNDATKHIVNGEKYCFNAASYKTLNKLGEQVISRLMDEDVFVEYTSHVLPNFSVKTVPEKGRSGDIFTFHATTTESLGSQYDVKIRLADGAGGFLMPSVMNANGSRKNFSYSAPIYNEGKRVFEVAIFSNNKQMSGWKSASYMVLKEANIAPTAFDMNVSTAKNKPINLKLKSYDENADTLSFTITSQPSHGDINGTAPNLTYTPNTDYVGGDSFTFKVNDGKEDSNKAKVSISIKDTTIQPAGTTKVLKTGQTKCYNFTTHAEEVCNETHKGQDGYYQAGVQRDYNRSGNIVTDSVTKLQWQDDATVKTTYKNWAEVKTHCQNLTLDGFSDWRLPSISELLSITDLGRYNSAIDPTFQNTSSSNFWASTTDASYTSNAWLVYFYSGRDSWYSKSTSHYVRCVRARQ